MENWQNPGNRASPLANIPVGTLISPVARTIVPLKSDPMYSGFGVGGAGEGIK